MTTRRRRYYIDWNNYTLSAGGASASSHSIHPSIHPSVHPAIRVVQPSQHNRVSNSDGPFSQGCDVRKERADCPLLDTECVERRIECVNQSI